ncbi:MAG: sel1 repeat family protein [Eubacterium sp.]|nr:sel1 repeat family protein [Eubacterium sp.]
MAKVLSAEVKQALQDIYYNVRTGRGKAAFVMLEKASAAGDGDASCILARCYCGEQYVWIGHGFPENDDRAVHLIHKSVEQGSALGVMLALRSGELTPAVQKTMPFASLQEAFDEVLELAKGGDAFCQYTVANSYFWWDFLRIQGRDMNSFPSQAELKAYLKENISKCEDWFWKAFRGGMYFAANNLNRYYTQGDEDIIAPRPEMARDLWKMGAEYGYPLHQAIYADNLVKAGRDADALHWYKQAAEGGHPGAWSDVGRYYYEGIGVGRDEAYAVECFEKDIPTGNVEAHNMLGRAYFQGRGVAQDYAKAYSYLNYGYSHGSKWGVFFLAQCFFYGYGTKQDYVLTRKLLDEVYWDNWEADYLRGMIYANGLGVAQDIPKGVMYLQRAGDHEEAKAELSHYKKTLFGRWVHR